MKSSKAFTLIELAIVLLVIGILAGLMLRNVGMYSIQARDTKRRGDLRNLAVNLVQYNAANGQYPGTSTLVTDLQNIGIANLPADPINGRYYDYFVFEVGGSRSHFVLRAQLEQPFSANPALYADSYNSSTAPWSNPSGVSFRGNTLSNTPPGFDCSASTNYYCIAQ